MSARQGQIIMLASLMLVWCTSALAQEQKNELSGILGRVFISDQGIHGANAPVQDPFVRSGKGVTFEINYARLLFFTPMYSISGELPVAFNLDEDLSSGGDVVPRGYRQIFVSPAVRFNLFPATAVSPWVSLGGGVAHFSEDKNLNYYGVNPGSSSSSGLLQGGLGLDVRIPHRFSLRGQVRDFWSGTPELPLAEIGKTRQHNFFVGAGVVWHF